MTCCTPNTSTEQEARLFCIETHYADGLGRDRRPGGASPRGRGRARRHRQHRRHASMTFGLDFPFWGGLVGVFILTPSIVFPSLPRHDEEDDGPMPHALEVPPSPKARTPGRPPSPLGRQSSPPASPVSSSTTAAVQSAQSAEPSLGDRAVQVEATSLQPSLAQPQPATAPLRPPILHLPEHHAHASPMHLYLSSDPRHGGGRHRRLSPRATPRSWRALFSRRGRRRMELASL